jgi:LacI family transcriptional regulator
MKRRKLVALLIETSNSYARSLLEGVISYVREHDCWSVYLPEQQRGGRPPTWLNRWPGDGIIARIENREIANAVVRTGLPVIDVSAARMVPGIPWVETDDAAIVSAAVEHLSERGFRHLAFCGEPRFNWSRWRWESFRKIAQEAEASVWEYQTPPALSWDREQRRLKDWIRWLPRPVGVMACYDIKGQQLLDACRDLGVAVPEEIAVVGVDNDHLICDLCMPQLSSVIPNAPYTGYLAAKLLDELMRGKKLPATAHLIKPLGIHTRRSTDVLVIDDADVTVALRLIRERACDGIRVADLLREVSLSRRVLESRFLKHLGRTPHQEIERVKIERVKRLLHETDLPLNTIARRTGFSSEYYLSVAFKRAVGQPPSSCRLRTQAPAADRRRRS